MKITKIKHKSLAEMIGLHPGDRLLKINGKRVIDEIDYKFRMSEEKLVLDLEIDGKLDRVEIEKEYDDNLGVEFEVRIHHGITRAIRDSYLPPRGEEDLIQAVSDFKNLGL